MVKNKKGVVQGADQGKRPYLSQADVPSCNIEDALRVTNTIQENYGGKPVTPIQLALAMEIAPTSGGFRMLCGASIAYGLTEGGYNATTIKLLPLAQRIVRPLKEGDDLAAKREALLTPRVISEFLKKYNGAPIPKQNIGQNVLSDMGVPLDKTEKVFNLIVDSAESLGLISDIRGKKYVDLKGADILQFPKEPSSTTDDLPQADTPEPQVGLTVNKSLGTTENDRRRRIFITHGKDTSFIDPIKKLLIFGELDPVISVEQQSVSEPVPDKVMKEMRSCGGAIIHVNAEQKLFDKNMKEQIVLNPNVLIEIGAAMALYGRRFILLVKNGITLPSNLQGLFEVRYDGDTLNGETTIKLLEAIRALKSISLPEGTVS